MLLGRHCLIQQVHVSSNLAFEPHVCGCLFSARGTCHLKPNTRGRSDAEKHQKSLSSFSWRLHFFQSLVLYVWFLTILPVFQLHTFVPSDLGGTRVLLGPLGRGAAGPGKSIVEEENHQRSLLHRKFGDGKLMQTGNLVEWMLNGSCLKIEHQWLFPETTVINPFFGMVSSPLHVFTIQLSNIESLLGGKFYPYHRRPITSNIPIASIAFYIYIASY